MMANYFRSMLLKFLRIHRRRRPACASTLGRWTFLADCGSGRMSIIIREPDGRLIHQETMTADDVDRLLIAARSIAELAAPRPERDDTPPDQPFPRLHSSD